MLFEFLKYLQPTHYFQLYNTFGVSVFPIAELLPEAILKQLEHDASYLGKNSTAYDLSWQAIQLGYIGPIATYSNFKAVPIFDNYRFLRKNFHSIWVFYVLLLRLLSFKNPIQELAAFFKTRNVKRRYLVNNALKNHDYTDFQSKLIASEPLVTVIIPTLNRYSYLTDVLRDLEKQDYPNFEVLVVDQSNPFQESFYQSFELNIVVTYQNERALWLARNSAIKNAKGDYILLFDDDSRIPSDWIHQHLKCLDYFGADLSSGVSISEEGAKTPENYSFFRLGDQLDTGNVLLKKAMFTAIGLFDRQFEKQRMGDGEFGLRAHLKGFLNVSNPLAKRLHLKARDGGLREMGSWDALRPKKWFAPRPIPSVLYYYRRYFGSKMTRLALLRTMPSSIMPYRYKRSSLMMLVGALISIVVSPLILFQIFKSWQLASKKIKEGPKIELL